MKPNCSNRSRRHFQSRGFALVISLSLMVLLTVLSVGLLTLSSLSLRASGAGEARAEAEANARLALMLAIGELQTSMGPDQRVSARATVVNESASEPNALGAWDSWHWQPNGSSSAPSYSEKEAKFRRWLVSTTEPDLAKDLKTAQSDLADPIWMINPETVGSPSGTGVTGPSLRASRVPLEFSETHKGGFAWAVMDESQKAPIQLPEVEPANNGEKIAQRVAPGRARPEDIVEALAPKTLGDPAKVVSLDSAVVAVGKEAGKEILSYQADVTPYSVGLLSNVAEGGLKTDLTTIFESSSVSPNVNDQATVYFTAADGAPRWDYLRSHYQNYRRVSQTSAGTPVMNLTPSSTDLRPAATGITPAPATERLMPVVAKLQIMFSAVSHYSHLSDRIQFFNDKGSPKGNENYGVPHLVYDPVVTLYNPYDIALNLQKLRIRVWDPPVLFGMKKNGDWLRQDFASGNFQGLARFQIANENNPNARRAFCLFLREKGSGGTPGAAIRMEPGEVKVFSPWVEPDWTWGMETAGGYTVRSFFDWNAGNDFGNKDGRTGQKFGIESVPGWDPRAGLQTDHLSYSSRPEATRYAFEKANNWNGGWLGINIDDTFTIQAKPGRALTTANLPDFRVDLLAGQIQDYDAPASSRDILRTYQFRFGNPAAELTTNPSNPVISRTFQVRDILQKPADKGASGKSPFAILTMAAKTTIDPNDLSMPWVQNHPVVEGVDQNSGKIGNALDTYDMNFAEVQDFNTFPGIELDPGTNRGFYGASSTSNRGVSNVPMFRVPLIPAASLGDMIPGNLVVSSNLPRVTHAFGNSHAHPLIPSNGVSRSVASVGTGKMLDHSYLLNDALWDSTYFSTVGTFSGSIVSSGSRGELLKDFMDGKKKLLNPRFIPILVGRGSAEDQAKDLDGLDDTALSRRMASALAIQGPFNVNSDSVGAWKAMLSSLRDGELLGWNNSDKSAPDKTAFPRATFPIAGDAEGNSSSSIAVAGQKRWAGFRALNDDQIAQLAQNIVTEIRATGKEDKAPCLTLAEFINRRLGGSGALHVQQGLLQTAINNTSINTDMHRLDSKDLRTTPTTRTGALTGIANDAARQGYSAEGAPSMLTQGDLLMALAPVITVRGDTFRVRAYGESRTPEGKVSAKAWCEAIVQRSPEYLDPTDSPEVKPAALKEDSNLRFGRRFNITSFRWLSPDEV